MTVYQVFTLIVFLASLVMGTITQEAQAAEESSEKSPSNSFGLSASIASTSSLHQLSDARRTADLSFALMPNAKLPGKINLSVTVAASKDLEGDLETHLLNPNVFASKSFQLKPYLSLTPRIGSTLALNEDSIKRDSLLGAGHLGFSAGLNLTRIESIKGLSISFSSMLTRNLHQFTTSRTGSSNTMAALSNSLALAYSLTEKFVLSAGGSRAIGWTYNKNGDLKNSYALSQSLTYAVNSKISADIGHTVGGAAYKENGIESAIELFDENQSMLFGSLTVSI